MTDGFNKSMLFDPSVFRLFCRSGEVVEVRIVKVYSKSPAWGKEFARETVSGHFDDHGVLCKAIWEANKFKQSGIYFTLQVIDPRLIGRAFNHLHLQKSRRQMPMPLPMDLDPPRPSGISSPDSELKDTLNLRVEMVARIVDETDFSLFIKTVSVANALSNANGSMIFGIAGRVQSRDENQ